MRARWALWGTVGSLFLSAFLTAAATAQSETDTGWRPPGGGSSRSGSSAAITPVSYTASPAPAARDSGERREPESPSPYRLTQHSVTTVSAGGEDVQGDQFPISIYTQGVTSTAQPQQAVIDWILRETGYETWHGALDASLSADRSVVRVRHTAEKRRAVKAIVDRFNNQSALTRAFGIRVITLDEPDWRARAFRTMKSVPTQSSGVAAWLLEREHAAALLAELGKRSDFREPPENNTQPMLENGQSFVLSSTRSISYLRDISGPKPPVAGPQPLPDQLQEGLSLEFSPLLSADNTMVDAVLKCHIDQVEALRPVMVDVPVGLGVNQSVRLDVPQMSQFRLQERFRWPVDQVLLVSLGLVPSPYRPAQQMVNIKSLGSLNFGENVPGRCEVLVFIECKGKNSAGTITAGPTGIRRQAVRTTYHHRY
jgi:hypothetical protein